MLCRVLQNVQRRMEAIYGSTQSHSMFLVPSFVTERVIIAPAVHRAHVRASRTAEIRKVVEPYELSFLDWAYRPPSPPKRKWPDLSFVYSH